MIIRLLHETETMRYAAEELKKYLRLVDETVDAMIVCGDGGSGEIITLGVLSDLSLRDDDVSDPIIDDVVDVCIKNLSGYIAGSNERSILMGVYKYLKSAGCRWVRPGNEGEYIPKADMKQEAPILNQALLRS